MAQTGVGWWDDGVVCVIRKFFVDSRSIPFVNGYIPGNQTGND
jgi:hypothetical protein